MKKQASDTKHMLRCVKYFPRFLRFGNSGAFPRKPSGTTTFSSHTMHHTGLGVAQVQHSFLKSEEQVQLEEDSDLRREGYRG